METLIVLVMLALLAVPVLLVVALVGIGGLKRRVGDLEAQLAAMRASWEERAPRPHQSTPARAPSAPVAAAGPKGGDEPQRPAARYEDARPQPRSAAGSTTVGAEAPAAAGTSPGAAPAPTPALPKQPTRPAQAAQPRPVFAESAPEAAYEPAPGLSERAFAAVARWFTTGNVIAKVGMLVLLAGVAALLKYASDQGWLTVPIGWRLAGIAAAAVAALAFGWRRREGHRVFALTLQGGAIGVLLLTVFAAFRLYGLLPVLPAFAISVLLVAALCALAVLQHARTLAIFGILAGFLAPVWLSTGACDHVVLFSYYALLNLGVLAIAWLRPWRELNLLGFAFTWGIGVVWGVLQYDPSKLATTQPFLLLFFAFYLVIPLLYLRRKPGHDYDRIDGSLVFGTPLVAFPLQAVLLDGERMPLALCALALAALYAVLAWRLLPKVRYRTLGIAHAMLATGFATLAIPLAFSARATACLFALEGAALIWLGLRNGRLLPRVAGAGLQGLAALAFLFAVAGSRETDWMFANAVYASALLIAVGGFASAWAYWRSGIGGPAATVAFLWGLLWWCTGGLGEIDRFVPSTWTQHAMLALLAATAWLAAEAHRALPQPQPPLRWTVAAALALALPLAFAQSEAPSLHPLALGGLWAWAAFALLGARALWCLRDGAGRAALVAQFCWWLAWPLALSLSALNLVGEAQLAQGWRLAATALPWLAAAALALYRWGWLRPPLGMAFDAARPALQAMLFALLAGFWLHGLFAAGAAAPLPWWPLLNPLEAMQIAILMLAAGWMRSFQAPAALATNVWAVTGTAAFAFASAAVLRAVHHWTGVGWSSALWSDPVAQAALTVLWSVLGMAAWIAGSRRGLRGPWLAGAVLMGVVLAKLVVVDRQYLGNLTGIVSFIAYGGLCMVVGYLAPVPPPTRHARAASVAE
ncbi:DUF2339 domain-containing protein [Luteimonas sp. SJ-92]|uniref:DUF2339 domain-containing protein n=1 Tax=Luteimonas salinisoli TaxID=2752307 RepID=A0A853J862_9GAMM|nr:DUF2339 domain-containing protein [Luteimonas salinisoli]NZA24934.1 DUF2339 domain-containing protein [Luteimonas salinisoli]